MSLRRPHLYNFRGLMCAALAFIGLAVAAMGYTVWKLREDAIVDAYQETGDLATVLSDEISRTVGSIDLVLGAVDDRLQSFDLRSSDQLTHLMSKQFGHDVLKSISTRFPESDVLSVLNAQGQLIVNSRAFPTPPIDLSDRDYVKVFQNTPRTGTYISYPVFNRTTGAPTVFFSRPVRNDTGELIGVVGMGVQIAQLRRSYETIGQFSDHGFMLSRMDGTTLMSFPGKDVKPGQMIPADSPWHRMVAEGGGAFRTRGQFTSGPRLVSVRLVPGYPLAVSVGVMESTALALWWERSLSIAAGTILAAVCSLFLLMAVGNRVRLLRKSDLSITEQGQVLAARSRELETAKAQIDGAIHNMRQGISMYDHEMRLVLCNERYLALYDLSPDVVKPGCTIGEILAYRKSLGNYVQDPQRQGSDFAARAAAGESYTHNAHLPNGTIIAVSANPMPGGGWVSTHEDITERHRAELLIAHMARHDALTDLPNRAVFDEKMTEACGRLKRGGGGFAVMVFDLDKFKDVNDTHGHPGGDLVLKTLAYRVRASIRDVDCPARLGGDEFAILLAPDKDPELAARILANRLLDAVAEPLEFGEQEIRFAVSIGIAVAPRDGASMDELLRNADLALYRAKAEGRNRLRFFEAAAADADKARKSGAAA